jgi:hypothetical protein
MSNQLKKAKAKAAPFKNNVVNNYVDPADEDLARYATAVMDPFNTDAVGARIPDIQNQGTLTTKAEGIVTLSSNASGVCSFAVCGNPLFSFMDLTTASTSSAASGMSNMGANSPHIYGAAALGNLVAEMATCRTVGWGYRLRNQLPPTTATGRIEWACVPCTGDIPGYAATLNLGVFSNNLLKFMTGAQYGSNTAQITAGAPSSIMAYPCSGEFSIQDIISSGMEFTGKICDYSFVEFHNTNIQTSINATNSMSTNTAVLTSTLAPLGIDNESCSNYRGWNVYIIRMEGLPVSTVIAELDYIYHFEGSPPAPASSVGIIVPDSAVKSHVNTAAHQKIVDLSVVSKGVHIAEQFFAGNYLSAGSELIGKKNTRKAKSFIQKNLFAKLGLNL